MLQINRNQAALLTAYLIAAHQVFDADDLIYPDQLAIPILGADAEAKLARLSDYFALESMVALRRHVALCAAYREKFLRQAVAGGVSQFVVLAAGFDTFAYRLPEWARHLKIIEVDDPFTTQQKLNHLKAAEIATPDNVCRLECSQEDLSEFLNDNELICQELSFVSWFGESMYLARDKVLKTFEAFTRFKQGSSIMLDYMLPMNDASKTVLSAMSFLYQTEPPTERYQCYLSATDIVEELNGVGFRHAEQLYCHSNTQNLDTSPPRSFGLLLARS